MNGFRLREGLTFCRVGDRLIFLDLPADRYFCLGNTATDAFERLLASPASPTLEPSLVSLVDRQMLIPGKPNERPMPCPEPTTAGSLHEDADAIPRWRDTTEALARRFSAEARLRWQGLSRALSPARFKPTRSEPHLDVARAASAAFARSALIRSRQGRCVSISVATKAWLAARDCAATLIIGVKLYPFQAHCWILVGDRLVNDDPDAVRPFTPILIV